MNDKQNQAEVMKAYFYMTVIFTLLTSVAEWGSYYAYFQDFLSLAGVFYVHLGVVAFLTIWLWLQIAAEVDIKLISLILVMTTVTGPFGSFISVLMLVSYLVYSKSEISFLQWLSALFPDANVEKSVELYQRLSAGWDDFSDKQRIMSFQDAISLGTIPQKREALSKISRYYRRDFAPALLSAIHDSNNAIRVQAATVIAKFEQEYMSRYMSLSRQHQGSPQDNEILLKLAQQADAYAYSGILDQERENSFQNIAAEKYRAYLDKVPGDTQILFSLGRLYIHLRHPELAYQLLKGFMQSDPKQPLNLMMWFIEALYCLERHAEIRQLIKTYHEELTSDSDYPLIILDTVQLWEKGIPEEKLVIKYANET